MWDPELLRPPEPLEPLELFDDEIVPFDNDDWFELTFKLISHPSSLISSKKDNKIEIECS